MTRCQTASFAPVSLFRRLSSMAFVGLVVLRPAAVPGVETCLDAGSAQIQAGSTKLGAVQIFPPSSPSNLKLTDCNGDGVQDLLVPHGVGPTPARIDFSAACPSPEPTKVSITFTSDDVVWEVVYADGTSSSTLTLVDSAPQKVTFTSAVGIREVVITAAPDVCIHEICYDCPQAGADSFRRGDSNSDGVVDMSDGIWTLNFLFLGESDLACEDASDFNDDAQVDIADAIACFGFLFVGKAPPPAPAGKCGVDLTRDRLGPCRSAPCGDVPTR